MNLVQRVSASLFGLALGCSSVVVAPPVAGASEGAAQVESAHAVSAQGLLGISHDGGRLAQVSYHDPASVAGLLESALYTDVFVAGQWVDFAPAAAETRTWEEAGQQVIQARMHVPERGIEIARTLRAIGNQLTFDVEVTNHTGAVEYTQIEVTNMLNTDVPQSATASGTALRVQPELGGYLTTLHFSEAGLVASGAATSPQTAIGQGVIGAVDDAGARIQRGRWMGHIHPGETMRATTTLTFETQESAVDSDGDGLPDLWETHGVTLRDGTVLPLHQWGADPQRPDVFLQLNWMKSEWESVGCAQHTDDAATQQACDEASRATFRPSRKILQELVDKFAEHGVNLHIDAGEYYTNMDNYAQRFGGPTNEYQRYYFDGVVPGIRLMENVRTVLGDRSAVFRQGLIGDQMSQGKWATGIALLRGNTFFIAHHERAKSQEVMRNTIMHELGHTLGLDHNGSTALQIPLPQSSYIPNYYSVMNYLYQFTHFDYSDTESVSGGPLPQACNRVGVQCYTGDYRIPADWENLVLNAGNIGQPLGRAGVEKGVGHAELQTVERNEAAIAAAEAHNGRASLALIGAPTIGVAGGSVAFELRNPGVDLQEYEVEFVYPGGSARAFRTLAGVGTDPAGGDEGRRARLALDIQAGQLRVTSLPIDVRVRNTAGEIAFEQRFTLRVDRDGRDGGESDMLAGASRAPQTPAPAPAGSDVAQSKTQEGSTQGSAGEPGAPKVAAIVVPIVAVLALLGGAIAAFAGGIVGSFPHIR